MVDFSLLPLLVFRICLWKRTSKLQSFGSSCFWDFHCFSMDSKELSSISDCFGDQITNKNIKTYRKWLEMIAKVLNMLIGLKGDNYYSKVFKRVNYKLSNSTFWVVIKALNAMNNSGLWMTWAPLGHELRSLNAINRSGLFMTWITWGHELKAIHILWTSQDCWFTVPSRALSTKFIKPKSPYTRIA